MCIAIIKPKGQPLPSKKILRTCWIANPDGAGFMYNDGEKVTGHKGFMTFDGFYSFLKKANERLNLTDKDVVLHLRIATHGGINKECTHPFPVTANIDETKLLDFESNAGFAHNGIISGYGTSSWGKKSIIDSISDTMDYDVSVLAHIHDLENSEKLLHALAMEHSSRFALLFKDKYIKAGGWVFDDGIYYSNSSYKPYEYVKTTKTATPTPSYDDYTYEELEEDLIYSAEHSNDYKPSDYLFKDAIDGVCDYCGYVDKVTDTLSGWQICKECYEMFVQNGKY